MNATDRLRAHVLAALGAAPLTLSGCIVVVSSDKDATTDADDSDSTPDTVDTTTDDTDDTDTGSLETGDSSESGTPETGDSGDTDTAGSMQVTCPFDADLDATAEPWPNWQGNTRYRICLPTTLGSVDCDAATAATMDYGSFQSNPTLEAIVDAHSPPICDTGDGTGPDTGCTSEGYDVNTVCGPDTTLTDCCFVVTLDQWAIGRPFLHDAAPVRARARTTTAWLPARA